MTAEARVLVVGGDSMIGDALARRLAGRGVPHTCTTRRREGEGRVPLDLAADPRHWRLPPDVSTAVLAAAVTSTATCREHPDEARRVNVTGVVELARRLTRAGARVVFLSSNMVFDGTVPGVPPDAAPCPRTAYGRFKAEAEQAMLALGAATTIVRFTKVIGPGMPLLSRWQTALGRDEVIRPFADMVMAPVAIAHAVDALEAVIRERRAGIFQVSASADVTYADAALALAARWQVKSSLVRPMSAAKSGVPLEHLPAHTTLDSSAVEALLGKPAPSPWEAITGGS